MQKNKQGQIAGQSLIFVLSIIIVGMLLLFGVKSIFSLKATQKNIEQVQLEKSISKEIQQMIGNYGSQSNTKIGLLDEFSEVCFADLSVRDRIGSIDARDPVTYYQRPYVQDILDSGVKENVFIRDTYLEHSFYVPGIELEQATDGFLCIQVRGGSINLGVEGKGKTAIVYEWGN